MTIWTNFLLNVTIFKPQEANLKSSPSHYAPNTSLVRLVYFAVNLLPLFREDIVAKTFIGFQSSASTLYMSYIMVTRLNGGRLSWLLGLAVIMYLRIDEI